MKKEITERKKGKKEVREGKESEKKRHISSNFSETANACLSSTRKEMNEKKEKRNDEGKRK